MKISDRRLWRRSSAWVPYLLLTALPLGAGLVYALLYGLGLVGALSSGFTLDHVAAVAGGSRFWADLAFSIGVALGSLLPATALALWWTLSYRDTFQRGWMPYALYLPLAFPAMVAGFVAFQLWTDGGLFARVAYHLGLIERPQEFPGLVHDPWGLGIMLTHLLMAAPFLTLLFLAIWDRLQLEELMQTSRSLGSSVRQAHWRVAIPILLREARPTLWLYGIFVAGSYEIPLLIGAQHPQMMSVYIWTKLSRFDLGDRPQAYVAAFLFTLGVLALLAARGYRKPAS